jgi:hypothetical protein
MNGEGRVTGVSQVSRQGRSERAQRVSHGRGQPSRLRRFGESAVALAEAEAGSSGVPASDRVGESEGRSPSV